MKTIFLLGAALAFALGPRLRADELPDSAAGYAPVHGLRLYYEICGKGPPLLLLHGGLQTIASSFAKQIPVFAETHRVIAVEQMGHGHTADADRELTYRGMAEDTAELLEQLKVTEVDVVGWSDGGIVGLILAAHHPKLVRRLVVSGANIRPDGCTADFLAHVRALKPEEMKGFDRREYDRFSPDGAEHFPVIFRKMRDLWLTAPTAADIDDAQLAEIQAPTLVIAGDHDIIRPEHTLEICQHIPHAELCILPGTSHNTFERRPEWVNPMVLSFLADDRKDSVLVRKP
jgi:pimeloyl-ACP methyl ester carboxylesterase